MTTALQGHVCMTFSTYAVCVSVHAWPHPLASDCHYDLIATITLHHITNFTPTYYFILGLST